MPPLPQREVAAPRVHTFREDPGPPVGNSGGGAASVAAPRLGAIERAPALKRAPSGPAAPAAAGSGMVAGAAVVRGPAALEIGGRPVRLFGIRAPAPSERCDGKPCTDRAADALRQLVSAGDVSCRFPLSAPHAVCRDRAGRDLAAWLVEQGWAVTDTQQSYDYMRQEQAAHRERRGLWQFR